MTRPLLLLSLWIPLLATKSSLACSIEIWSMAQTIPTAQHVVVGEITAVEEEIIYEEESGWQQRILYSATLGVEKVLKGYLESTSVELSFDPELGLTSCGGLADPYQEGVRMLLMLGDEEAEGGFRGPLVPPRIIVLGDESDFEDSPLFQFVEYVIEHGFQPIQVEFTGPNHFAPGQPMVFEMSVTNNLEEEIAVVITPDYPIPAIDQEAVVLTLNRRGEGQVRRKAEIEGIGVTFAVGPGKTRSLAVDLSQYYELSETGDYDVRGFCHLSAGSGISYRDHWTNFGPLYAFSIAFPAFVRGTTWGELKGVSIGRYGEE